ncbi:hypothetical protein [Aquimarina sp. 2304DJ70-9]|uniref:hypothetical protein n=1 Tax=Aquimarina penaris TaxID=3231044 RepID=UPI003462944A
MSNENYNNEINLMEIFKMIKESFRKLLKHIISVILFYKKKAVLFIVLLVIGTGIGYFLDNYRGSSMSYAQEIIIEPKYNSTKYIYDLINELEDNFEDNALLNKIGISEENIKNIKKITIEPIIKGTDVLDNLQHRYEDREFFKDVMNAYDENQVEEEKFRDFYKHHRLVFDYKNKSDANDKITESILKYIRSNIYYNEIITVTLKQKQANLEQNKKTLQFIEEYLTNLSNNPLKAEKGTMIISNNNKEELPTVSVASLLQKKELLLELINEQERTILLDKDLFSFVHYGDIIKTKKKIVNRKLFSIPLLLFGLVSLFFFFNYLLKQMNEFANNA